MENERLVQVLRRMGDTAFEEALIAVVAGCRPGRVLSHGGLRYTILAVSAQRDAQRRAWRNRLIAALPRKTKVAVVVDKATPEQIKGLEEAVSRCRDIPAVIPKNMRAHIMFDQSFDDVTAIRDHAAARAIMLSKQSEALRQYRLGEAR